jgi:hypothetical protein
VCPAGPAAAVALVTRKTAPSARTQAIAHVLARSR